MNYSKLLIMAGIAMLLGGCAQKQPTEEKQPISKPQITLQGDRLTPEALWAMGRIGSVKAGDSQAPCYNLSGQRMASPRGIYIQDHRVKVGSQETQRKN